MTKCVVIVGISVSKSYIRGSNCIPKTTVAFIIISKNNGNFSNILNAICIQISYGTLYCASGNTLLL